MVIAIRYLLVFSLLLSIGRVLAQNGPRSYTEGGGTWQAMAVWQSTSSQAARAAKPAGADEPNIKVCIGYRVRGVSTALLAQTKAYLVELDATSVRRWLSDAVYESPNATAGDAISARPFWCYFSDRLQPDASVTVIEGDSRASAARNLTTYPAGLKKLEFKQQPPEADLNRTMLEFVRER